jgi:predicted O-methyltransferase YrrM
MPLPQPVRRLAPDRLRYSVRLRSWALAAGLIPPRPMHSDAEARLLAELATTAGVAVEVGVYEGGSAVSLCRALPPDAELHLIDPFTAHPTLLPGWRGVEAATRRTVERAARERGGPRLHWHVELSADTAAGWSQPVDLVFVDGDHSVEGCRLDWELWSPHVPPGGTVVFHDARAGRPDADGLPGPTQVVDELFRGPDALADWEIHAEVDTAVAVRRAA